MHFKHTVLLQYTCVMYVYIYIYIYRLKLYHDSKSRSSKHLKSLNFLQAFSDLTLSKLKVSIRVLDVWMYLILI